MPYEGETLTYCPADMFDFGNAYAVIVSGARLNPYGHMLLNTGGKGGNYFQVSDVYGVPRMMNEEQFQRYLTENGKTIITVMPVPIPTRTTCKLSSRIYFQRNGYGVRSFTIASHSWKTS